MKYNKKRLPFWLALGLFALVALTACSGIVANSGVISSGVSGSGPADEALKQIPPQLTLTAKRMKQK